ncbi:hypothetical protein [uncultured Streptococcus sp.]|uniref:hypothetical protein n=1 Tax=uncultured Streptococcus sp. TaxID=83427 RepID=UPI0025DAF324|nr:hypothetical protein [uncultured Streptococcus sp.]
MTTKEEVKRIVDKYDQRISSLTKNGTLEEKNTVFKYIVDQANKRQRQLVGLEDVEE